MPAGVCSIRIEVVGAGGGPAGVSGAPGAGAQALADFNVTPGETLRVRVGGWGGEAVGSTPGSGGWNGGGAGGGALDDRGKAGAGGGGATDVRRGGDGLEHRIIVGAGGSGGAGGGIGGPIGTGGGDGGEITGEQGFAAMGSANSATGGRGGTADHGRRSGPERWRLDDCNGRLARSRRRRRRRQRQRRRRRRRRVIRRRRRRLEPFLQRRPRRRRLGVWPCRNGLQDWCRRRLWAREDQLRPRSERLRQSLEERRLFLQGVGEGLIERHPASLCPRLGEPVFA